VRAEVRRRSGLPRTQEPAQPTADTRLPEKPAQPAETHLGRYTESAPITHQRQWPTWTPWALMGSGLAIATSGVLLQHQSITDYRGYDAEIVQCGGCVPEPRLGAIRTRANTLQTVSYGTYVLGGASLVGGVVLLYFNRLQPSRTNPATGEERVNVTPLIGDTNGILTTIRF
jgi:hypothetical protein